LSRPSPQGEVSSIGLDVIEYPLIFFAGFAGSWHCVGMCGGFACALGSDPRGRGATMVRQLSYNLGRVTTYCFIGGLVGFLAAGLCTSGVGAPSTSGAQRVLAISSGLLMVFIGLQLLGWLRRLHGPPLLGFGAQFLAPALRDLLRAPGPAAPLAFGVFNGFLPCPLVYAFAAQAAGSGGALPGLLVMLAFGLGTFPAMLLMAGLGGWLRRVGGAWQWRRRGVDVAGAFIVLLGLITFARGALPIGVHLHLL
jgi:sulfite exporter TauE/SafE